MYKNGKNFFRQKFRIKFEIKDFQQKHPKRKQQKFDVKNKK